MLGLVSRFPALKAVLGAELTQRNAISPSRHTEARCPFLDPASLSLRRGEESCFSPSCVSKSQGWLCRILKWAKTRLKNKVRALIAAQLLGSFSSDL